MNYSRVYVEISNICNMNCSFCHGHSRTYKRMTEQEFSLVLDKLEGQTKYIYYHLMGEPLTHPLLPQFLRMATERGLKSVITTNGTLLAEKGQALIDAKIHKVSISVHSFEEGEDAAYERYMKDVAAFADAASRAGIIVVLRFWNAGYDDGRNDRSLAILKERLEGEWTENTKGLRVRTRLFVEYGDRFDWPDAEAEVQGTEFFCRGLRDHFGILCDGTIVPCCLDSEGGINLGNIFTDDVTDVLGSPRARAIVKGFDGRKASEDLCRRCGYAQRFV